MLRKGKGELKYSEACAYVHGRNDYTGGQQKQRDTDVYKNKEPVTVSYETLRLSNRKKIYMEKPTECFKVKALYIGYNYLQNTFSIY